MSIAPMQLLQLEITHVSIQPNSKMKIPDTTVSTTFKLSTVTSV